MNSKDFDTQILWGDSTGVYSTSKRTLLPDVVGYGIVVDIDVSDTDMDGDKDIVVSRVGDPTRAEVPPDPFSAHLHPLFYVGYFVQLIEQVDKRGFEDKTARLRGNEDSDGQWFAWIRMFDIDADGDVDIVVDNAARDLIWKNDGSGGFSRD